MSMALRVVRPSSRITCASGGAVFARCSCRWPILQATQHSAYRFEFVTVAYRWHPLHGRRLRAHQGARRDARDVVLVEDRPGLTRELPAWMCDAAACSAMTFGPPLVQVDALQALSAFLATLLQARTASRSSEPPKKEEVTDEPADETATKTACVEPGAGDRGAGEGAGVAGAPASPGCGGTEINVFPDYAGLCRTMPDAGGRRGLESRGCGLRSSSDGAHRHGKK